MITLADIEAARARLDGNIRRTPLIAADNLSAPISAADLYLKLECLQATGSFKARGATNRLLATPREQLEKGIVAASGGNHGVAVARTGALAGVAAHIFVPETIAPSKLAKLRQWGAHVELVGKVFDEADRAARAYAASIGAIYFHPFADPLVVAGQGTLALEVLDQLPDVDTFLIAIGGGGLIGGMGTAIRAPGCRSCRDGRNHHDARPDHDLRAHRRCGLRTRALGRRRHRAHRRCGDGRGGALAVV
jgi:threonine dehydratase